MGFLKKFFQSSNPVPLKLAPEQQSEPPTLPLPIKPLLQTKPIKPNEKILAIEAEAISLGWTRNQLWQESKRMDLRGLASIIKKEQSITSVTRQYIQLERISPTGKLEIQRFYNHKVEQPWIKTSLP